MQKILLFITLCVSLQVSAQEIELIGLRLYNGAEQNNKKQRMEIGLLIKDTIQMVSLSPKSKIELLQDSKGKNLKVPTYKNRMINFQQSQLVNEGLGILIETAVIPSKKTKHIHLKGELSYTIVDNAQEKSMILKDVDFNNWQRILVEDKSIPLRKGSYTDSKKGRMVSFQFNNNNAPYYIKDMKLVKDGRHIEGIIDFKRFTNEIQLAIPEELVNQKYAIGITYSQVKTKTIPINKEFGLGL